MRSKTGVPSKIQASSPMSTHGTTSSMASVRWSWRSWRSTRAAVAAGPPAELVLEHAGTEALEVYGGPARLAEVEAEALSAGLRTRRTGTSVSILGIDARNGFDLEGERRSANLEDVFVLLTGEEIA
jgi:hypothetical protein